MLEKLIFYLALVIVIVLLIMLANKIKVAYPVLLVIAGLGISFIPAVPPIHITPELIFLLFLPPLLYEAAWSISWKELWRWRRIVGSFAFGVVFFTALSVALISNAYIPGFTLALGFLLGGIVSPPDAVSAGAILKFVKVPRRMSSILEGESLLNDASSLIIFQFALIAVATGKFVLGTAILSFLWMVLGGVAVGLVVGWLFMKMHKYLPTDANMDIILTIVTPYVMYIVAEEVHSSGVLAVVSGGLLLSSRRHVFLTSSSRLRGFNVWESLVFILNGVVFLMIGLDLPQITEGLKQENVAFGEAIGYGLLITVVLIIGRVLMGYAALIATLIMRNFIEVADPSPGMKAPFLLGWTGMRGVVSLAAALSIPVQLADGTPFPHRNLILFITFIVILTTLLVQGLTLPYLIRRMKFPHYDDYLDEEEAEALVRRELAKKSWEYLNDKHQLHIEKHTLLQYMNAKWKQKMDEHSEVMLSEEGRKIYKDVLEKQRTWLLGLNHKDKHIDEEVIRRHMYQIDIEEEKVRYM